MSKFIPVTVGANVTIALSIDNIEFIEKLVDKGNAFIQLPSGTTFETEESYEAIMFLIGLKNE